MSKPTHKSAAFLQALTVQQEEKSGVESNADKPNVKPSRSASRNGLKHIGGYFDRNDVEKFAILRARLSLDNSGLIKLAIEELYRKHEAKRAFGDT
jgi:hypothetical protein